MRLREFLQFFADAFLIPRSEQPAAIAAALAVAGLTERKEQFVEELSFGLKQRLFLAKTLLHKPKVLLLDEPATGLDPIARLDLRKQLKELNAAGVTILISSHILADLEDICTRVALISYGKNVTSVDGYNVAELSRPDVEKRIYDIELLGAGEPAVKVLENIVGATILTRGGDNKFSVEVLGGSKEGAVLLRGLITAGIDVVRFDYRSGSLEALYQEVFGEKKP
jgi:ABC-2 type transport system ATP-binding protein